MHVDPVPGPASTVWRESGSALRAVHAVRALPPDAPAPDPVRVAVTGAPDIVVAGVERMLSAQPRRVRLGRPGETADSEVVLFDPGRVTTSDLADLPGKCVRLAITPEMTPEVSQQAHAWGARHLVPLSAGLNELVSVLEEAGGRRPARRCSPLLPDPGDSLSPREREIVAGVCRGLSNPEIGGDLYLSVNTVKTYIRSAYRKMEVSTRAQAVLWGLRRGY